MSKFLNDNYISKLEKEGWVKVDKIYLPDGTYHKYGGGYQFSLALPSTDIPNTFDQCGYAVITNDGIRGSWRIESDKVMILNGLPLDESVYQIMTNDYSEIRDKKIDIILK